MLFRSVQHAGQNFFHRLRRLAFEAVRLRRDLAFLRNDVRRDFLARNCEGMARRNLQGDDFKQLVKDITLQIAAGHPFAVSREEVPADVIAKEREIAAQSDRLKGKPPQAMEKILAGMLDKFFQSYCLVDQGFVKKNSEISVKEHVAQVAKQLGDGITIRRFVRFQVGESA